MNTKPIIGYTTGVFDLFHIGHLNILRNAKSLCDYLIVGVTTDEISLLMKGNMPVIPFEERFSIVKSIKYVDKVVAKTSTNNKKAWEKLKFDIMIKGDDWKGTKKGMELEKELAEVGVPVKYLPYTQETSSSILRIAISNIH
jgi:glycerol-3-phosphate cytidylyltransferase